MVEFGLTNNEVAWRGKFSSNLVKSIRFVQIGSDDGAVHIYEY